jgi:hypothetical protein
MRISARITVFAATLSLVGAFSKAGAQTTYFGQDLRWVLNGTPLAGTNSANARASFLSTLTGVGTESFESFAIGSGAPLPLSFSGAGTATLTNNGNVSDGSDNGRKATTGSRYWDLSTGTGGSQFTITFSQAIAAFGLYGTDVGDFGDQLTLSFYRNNVLSYSWSPTHGLAGGAGGANDGNLNFFGYINTVSLFDEVRFSSVGTTSQSEDFWGFDDMTIGSQEQVSVPEPASLALVATGLLGLAAMRRRQRPV